MQAAEKDVQPEMVSLISPKQIDGKQKQLFSSHCFKMLMLFISTHFEVSKPGSHFLSDAVSVGEYCVSIDQH